MTTEVLVCVLCRRDCTVALQAPGKMSYFFGDLSVDDTSAEQVLACAALHPLSPTRLDVRAPFSGHPP